MAKKKYIASFANVTKGKTATFGFKEKKFKTLEDFAEQCLRQAWIPVTVDKGHRTYDEVTKIHAWLRFDCDVKGERETILSVLESNGLSYICLPSTNYNPKDRNYKWHISVPVEGQSNDPVQYKWQMKQALVDLGIDLHDRRVTEVCVQNMNPYKNGDNPVEGVNFISVKNGSSLKLKKPPKDLHYSEMTKTIFNGEGTSGVIPKKVKFASENLEVLSPESGIKIQNIGWVQLKDLNLDVGSMIGGLSCPAHNINHNNGKGGHQTGYAFATMNEGGDVWVQCTGAECQGRSYKVDYDDFGANTKLSDLFQLRQIVSLSAFNYDKSSIYNIKDDGSYVMFRWKEVFDFWDKELFWKLSMVMGDVYSKRIFKLEKKKKKAKGNIGLCIDIDKKIEAIKLENEYHIISEALSNDSAFEYFKNKYPPKYDGHVIVTYPHELYINDVVENIGKYIKKFKQFNGIEYKIDPFAPNVIGEVDDNTFKITINSLMTKYITYKPKMSIVEDYKEHNPYLDDMLKMIMAQRFGADRKTSYLWLKADSNWGKSFLFDGMMEGLSFSINESETKNAVKGLASGLEPTALVKSLFLFFDEFKGAVSELKNITYSIPVTPKFKSKHIIPVFMKIFASAEHISSLDGSNGMEEQFRNRFLHMQLNGSLIERDLYMKNIDAYGKSISAYINHKLWDIQSGYMALGRAIANVKANEVYSEMVGKYTIKNHSKSLDDNLNVMFKEWVATIISREWEKGVVEHISYRDVLIIHKNGGKIYITNKSKLKDIFIEEFVAREEQATIRHKTVELIIGQNKRTSVTYRGSVIMSYLVVL